MTIRSWDRTTITGTSEAGYPAPYKRDTYSQNGANASRADRLARKYGDHPYTASRKRYTQPASTVRIYWDTNIRKTNVSTFGAWASFETVPPPDLTKVVNKLLEKWRGSTINAGVTIGEGKESAQMIIDNLNAIANSARELRRKNFGGALAALAKVPKNDRRKALKAMSGGYFANAWLELQYGWKPLINDIYAYAEFVKTEPQKNIIRASKREYGYGCTGLGSYPTSDVVVQVNESRRHLKVTVLNEPSIYERLGLTDPGTIAWELIPFSFVVDWFLPIGDLLVALHAKGAMKVRWCCDTQFSQKKAQLPVTAGKQYGQYVCHTSAIASFDEMSIKRQVYPSLPSVWQLLGNQVARTMIVRNDPVMDHLANAAALARSQLNKLKLR